MEYFIMSDVFEYSSLEKHLSRVLGCKADLVHSVWFELKLDNFENGNDIKELRQIVHKYEIMLGLLGKLSNVYSSIPDNEKSRLSVDGNRINSALNLLSKELAELQSHRKEVINRNPSQGGKDPRADQLAEFVAAVFERSNRPITYGIRDNAPTTDFCRAVQKTLQTCECHVSEIGFKVYPSNWRQPALKAYLKTKP